MVNMAAEKGRIQSTKVPKGGMASKKWDKSIRSKGRAVSRTAHTTDTMRYKAKDHRGAADKIGVSGIIILK